MSPISLNTTRGMVAITGATCWADVVEVLREALKAAESGEPAIDFPDDSGWRMGVPREDWPEGLYYNLRTAELVMRGQQFGRPCVQRGYGSSVEVEAYPVDAWLRLQRKEASCA